MPNKNKKKKAAAPVPQDPTQENNSKRESRQPE